MEGGEGQPLFIGCVYMPTDSTRVTVVDSYNRLKENVLGFREWGTVVQFQCQSWLTM